MTWGMVVLEAYSSVPECMYGQRKTRVGVRFVCMDGGRRQGEEEGVVRRVIHSPRPPLSFPSKRFFSLLLSIHAPITSRRAVATNTGR